MGISITFEDKAINVTYQNVTGTTNSVAGAGAVFDITKTDGVYTTRLDSAVGSSGIGYIVGDTIIVAGTDLGGLAANNQIITVTGVDVDGKITTFATTGTGRIGDGIIDTIIDVDGTDGLDTFDVNADSDGFVVTRGVAGLDTSKIIITNASYGQIELNLNSYERVEFNDKGIAYDITGNAGKAYSILCAAFGQDDVTEDLLGEYIAALDSGKTLNEISREIVESDEFVVDCRGTSTTAFVKNVWLNVIGVEATEAQTTEFVGYLTDGTFTRDSILELASTLEGFHANIDLVGLSTTGIDYTIA